MNLNLLLILLQVEDIKEKMKNAPDGSYEIGVVIGTYLPFIILIIFAYILYYRMKNRENLDK